MIKKVKYNCFDVFFGMGWKNWVRMSSKDGKSWDFEKGDPKLAKGAASLLQRVLSKGQADV